MMDKPFISFIVPVYNAENYIERCIWSITKQKIERYEIILVNDGSTDSSLAICERLKKQIKEIKLISQNNQGQGGARNTGISYAKGKWLCFVDQDDWLEEKFYKECKKYLDNDVDVILFGKKDVYKHSEKEYLLNIKEKELVLEKEEDLKAVQLSTLNFFYKYKFNFGNLPIGTPWGKLIRTDLFKETNCEFIIGYGEDRPCMLKFYLHAKRIVIINNILYCYYVHNSTMRNYLPNAIEKYNHSLEEMNKLININFSNDKEFEKELWHFNIAWFSYCVIQDFCHKDNHESYSIRKDKFEIALHNEKYKIAFQMADLKCLPLRRKMLAWLIKHRMFFMINIMAWFNYLYNNISGKL